MNKFLYLVQNLIILLSFTVAFYNTKVTSFGISDAGQRRLSVRKAAVLLTVISALRKLRSRESWTNCRPYLMTLRLNKQDNLEKLIPKSIQ
ncbi:hypothetical protein HMPREF3291_09770 [Bacillus sp. HMSC76G11]|nr:hypothetical protein HMPREF3291_09770 [Bacillus sp. HMSC76G11]